MPHKAKELDFRLLDTAQEKTVQQQSVFETQTDSLLQGLDQAAVTMKTARHRRREAGLAAENSVSNILDDSTKLSTKAIEAAGNPFYDLISLFTDDPSLDEIAAQHNALQHRLTRVRTISANAESEFRNTVDEVRAGLQLLKSTRGVTQESIAQQATTARTLGSQIAARTSLANQQLDAMNLQDLRNEIISGAKNLPVGLVQARINQFVTFQANAQAAIAKAGTGELTELKKEQELVPDLISSLPDAQLQDAIAKGNGFSFGRGELRIHLPQHLLEAESSLRNEATQKQVALNADMAAQLVANDNAVRQTGAILQRVIGIEPATIVNEDGEVQFNLDVVPPVVADDLNRIKVLDSTADFLESKRVPGDLDTNEITQELAIRNKAAKLAASVNEKLIKFKQDQFITDEAKIAVKDFAQTGHITSVNTAMVFGIEELQVINPANISPETNGFGWSAGLQEFIPLFQSTLTEQTDGRLGQTGNIESDNTEIFRTMMLQSLEKTNRPTALTAFRQAIGETRPNPLDSTARENVVQARIVNEWGGRVLSHVTQQLVSKHDNEPQTQQVFQKLLNAVGTLRTELLRDDVNVVQAVFVELAEETERLIESGALPSGANLATEFQSAITNPELYESNFVTEMLDPKTPLSAVLASTVFNNAHKQVFVNSMRQSFGTVDIDELTGTIQTRTEEEKQSEIALRQATGAAPGVRIK